MRLSARSGYVVLEAFARWHFCKARTGLAGAARAASLLQSPILVINYRAKCCRTRCLPALCRYNEIELRWTTKETWVFTRQFNVSAALLNHSAVDLLLTGVDTVADIFVDNVKLASVANAHRRAAFCQL